MRPLASTLKPRKTPVQARSAATVDALHTATIQVLTREGLARCTTTRVAERAGMSVGSLYQYYPNRDALLAAVLARHLDGIAAAVERECTARHGQPVADMAAGLVRAFLAAKLRDPEESKALYAVAAERGGAELAARLHGRLVRAVADMLASAPDTGVEDAHACAVIALGALVGPVRALLEGMTPPGFEKTLAGELTRMLAAYFGATARTRTGRPARAG